ncbi:MAG TPA: M23 family metallopeptidase, partial [Acidimicrobiia bacterium]|nr:M23 family metallopeptidase [Acidimicrobiia bacterium]
MPLLATLLLPCLLAAPVSGPVVAGFAPQGYYGGHWGVDLAVPEGSPVGAAAAGTVTFAGSVAGMLTVTVNHGGVVRTSYSYLSSVAVSAGDRVARGTVVGASGMDHDRAAVHWSLRVGDVYVDPRAACRLAGDTAPAVRLAAIA